MAPLVGAFLDDYGDDNDDCNGFDGVENDGASSHIAALVNIARSLHAARLDFLHGGKERWDCWPYFVCCASLFPCADASFCFSADFLITFPWTYFRCFAVM